MKSLADLEKFVDDLIKRASAKVSQAPAQKSLLEIRTAILRDVKSRIEPAGRGKFVFPYNQIAVTVFSPDVANVFCVSESVNEALRTLVRVRRKDCRHVCDRDAFSE